MELPPTGAGAPMAAIFSFRCACCGEVHEGSPSFGFRAPDPYLEQPEPARQAGMLTSDLCRYRDGDGEHFFVRACLEVPIHGVGEPFLWGVWVSASRASFERYVAAYDAPDPSDAFPGWLCNRLPGYGDTYALESRVRPRRGGERPLVELAPADHPLAADQRRGISVARAQALAEAALHG